MDLLSFFSTDQAANRRNGHTIVPVQNCSHHHQYISTNASGRRSVSFKTFSYHTWVLQPSNDDVETT